MTAPTIARPMARPIPQLRRGFVYRVTTTRGTIVGEFLGIEVPHGDRAILLRTPIGTTSIEVDQIVSIRT